MGVNQKLLEYHIGRLKDKRAEIRLQSIQELVLLNDAGALEALRNLFATDTDAEVRKAAQEAGRTIFKSQANPNAQG
ncbi:MAG: HEAT repeat domain-containing protein [bacterium]|nr:HEAT repeat domain-containing protein [bacterium]